MRLIKLYGVLGKKFGRVHRFDVNTPAEAIRALVANFEGFDSFMCSAHEKHIAFKVVSGGAKLNKVEEIHNPASGVIKIIPSVVGAGAERTFWTGTILVAAAYAINVFLPGVGSVIAPTLYQAGALAMASGAIGLLAPPPKLPEPNEKNKPSYVFDGPVQTTAQGQAVPIAYGRVLVGSAVISGGITIEQLMGA